MLHILVICFHFIVFWSKPKQDNIDEYPFLLNVGEDNRYSLVSQIDHDLSYVPLNWKREMERRIKNIELKWAQSCNTEYVTELIK